MKPESNTPIKRTIELDEKGFVFIDNGHIMWCTVYKNQLQLFGFNCHKWNRLRLITQDEVQEFYKKAIPEDKANYYHRLHADNV